MKKIILLLFFFSTLFTVSPVLAQSVNLSGIILNSDIVNKAILTDGVKGSFCQVDLGITGRQLLTADIHGNFKLPDNIQTLHCTRPTEDIIFANVHVDFKQPIQGVAGNEYLYVIYNNQLLQINNYSNSSAYYPGAPSSFSQNIFNGGEEGNTPPYGDPKWLKYERAGNLIQIDDSLSDGYKPIIDSGYLMHFDENGKRKDSLFVYQGRIFKLVHAERKSSGTLLVDYSNKSNEASTSTQSSVSAGEQSYSNAYIDPNYYYMIKYPANFEAGRTWGYGNSSKTELTLSNKNAASPSEHELPVIVLTTIETKEINTQFSDPKELFGKYGHTQYPPSVIQDDTVQKVPVGKDTGYVIDTSAHIRDEIVIHGNVLVDIQTYDSGNSKSIIDQILSSFRFVD